jgi:hypothetical protein
MTTAAILIAFALFVTADLALLGVLMSGIWPR